MSRDRGVACAVNRGNPVDRARQRFCSQLNLYALVFPLASIMAVAGLLPVTGILAGDAEIAFVPTSRPAGIEVRIDHDKSGEIEASGLTWYPPGEVYLLVSDEHPAIFEMSHDGIVAQHIELADGKEVDDLESISLENGLLYLAASASKDRKGKWRPERGRFLRIRMQAGVIAHSDSIDLSMVLAELANNPATGPETRVFIKNAFRSGSIDIEAHAVRANRLYLGFKDPRSGDDETVILQLDDVAGLFNGATPQVSIHLKLKLGKAGNDKYRRLSDFVFTDDAVYLLSVASAGKKTISFLSRHDLRSGELAEISEYRGHKAEGMSLDPGGKTATIVFDGGGKKPSTWIRAEL